MDDSTYPHAPSAPVALRMIRFMAAESARVVLVRHALERQRQRGISRRQIERCLQAGYVAEGPFVTPHGHWQVTMGHYAAGEELSVVVVIDWPNRLIVITAFASRRAR